ncbi:MAG: DUF4199 domain-containing protein [Chitinophagaceae bacterium]|nr:DUF4199 domain-containing protein [Chitinophagaceae bacterium]
MTKNILTFGIIAGFLISTFMLISMNSMSHCEGSADYNTSMIMGYAAMLIAFSLVFVGIRNYRNKFGNGSITFGKAFKIGAGIVLVASTMYVIAWQIDYFFFMPDFMDKYSARMLEELRNSGATQAAIDSKSKEMADMAVMYKNPLFNSLITYAEIVPIGLLVTLISSLILKKKAIVTTVG